MSIVQPYSYLLFVINPDDTILLDSAIEKGELGIRKLGKDTYLGFFPKRPSELYSNLKRDFGIRGEIQWIELNRAEITK